MDEVNSWDGAKLERPEKGNVLGRASCCYITAPANLEHTERPAI